jgi:hypothetical protein
VGRPRKPIEQKALAGNPGKRNLPVPVAFVPGMVAIPEPPDGLEPAGERFWADVWTAGSVWLSPQLDYATVELASRTFDEIAIYRRALAVGPLLTEPIVSPSGKQVGTRFVANPAAKMLRDAEASLLKWLVVLAIPPTSRAVLGLVQVKAQSSLEQLMRGRNQPVVIDLD